MEPIASCTEIGDEYTMTYPEFFPVCTPCTTNGDKASSICEDSCETCIPNVPHVTVALK